MCLRLLVLGLHDQATASLIEIVFAIVFCVRVCVPHGTDVKVSALSRAQFGTFFFVFFLFFCPPHAR